MKIKEEDVRCYVPQWGGNRDQDEDSQIVLHLAPMTGGELRAVHRSAIKSDGQVDINKAQASIERIIKTRVVKAERCLDILDNEIIDGEELWSRAEQSLIDEAYSAITEISTLRAGLKKG